MHHPLRRERKHFCRYCLHFFSVEEILKHLIKYRFKINGKQKITMHKKGEYVELKPFEGKIKSPFIIYADFESILVSEVNEKQNPEQSSMKKYFKNVACSRGYELVCVDDKFSRTFRSYLGKDASYNLINRMIEERKNAGM